ncbi:alpha/beta-hydrolase [Cenococcum geophilum]
MFLQHFRSTIDHWDPTLINPLALTRPIFLFDNAGVGKSDGEVVDSFPGWAEHVIAFLTAFPPTAGKEKINSFSLSMGGMCTEMEEVGFLKTFYPPSTEKQELSLLDGGSPYLNAEGTGRQIVAVTNYYRLGELKMPVFVTNEYNDVLVPTENSWVPLKKISNVHLYIYPDVGHGYLNEYAALFGKHLIMFLD